MRPTTRARLSATVAAFRPVFAARDLRNLQISWSFFILGEWAYIVGLGVYAYQAGGPAAVAVVGLIRLWPSALAVPVLSHLGDRFRRERVILSVHLIGAAVLGTAAVAASVAAPVPVVYALVGALAVVSPAFRPVHWALLPSLVRSPEELAASNVASSLIEGVSTFAGPAVAGLLLTGWGPPAVFAASAGAALMAAIAVSRIGVSAPAGGRARRRPEGPGLLAGFRAIAANRAARVLVALMTAQTLVRGALNVLIVVVAIELLGLGEEGVGFLTSASGVGGFAGALLAAGLVGRRRLGVPLGGSLILWGVPIAVIGLWADPAGALGLLGLLGAANAVFDVAMLTLLQRSVPDEVLTRVFGAVEGLVFTMIGLGGLLVAPVITALGIRVALVVTGAVLPAVAVASWGLLLRIDAEADVRGREVDLVRGVPMFSALPVVMAENLAQRLIPLRVSTGTDVFREGDVGDRFYLVAGGTVEVTASGRSLAVLEAGGYFGEIALLRDVPRTATVTARSDVDLFALEREDFLRAVTGHGPSEEAADAVIGARLESLRSRVAAV